MTPDKDAPVLKIAVYADGRLTVDGAASSMSELRETLARLKDRHGVVWYYREATQDPPPRVAPDVMKAVVDARLPIRLSTRSDYSDSVGPGVLKPGGP
jgi:hypothetical protein